MSKESEDNKTLTLTVDDIGSEIEDAKVTCVKVFCPRRENNFVSFLCDGRFTVAGKSKVDIVEGGRFRRNLSVGKTNENIRTAKVNTIGLSGEGRMYDLYRRVQLPMPVLP